MKPYNLKLSLKRTTTICTTSKPKSFYEKNH
jgi:hypothetical protein